MEAKQCDKTGRAPLPPATGSLAGRADRPAGAVAWAISSVLAVFALALLHPAPAVAQESRAEPCLRYQGNCLFWDVRNLSFSGDGRYLAFSYAFHRDGRLLTPGSVAQWDIKSGAVTVTHASCNESYRGIVLSPDGQYRATIASTRPRRTGPDSRNVGSNTYLTIEHLPSRTKRNFLE